MIITKDLIKVFYDQITEVKVSALRGLDMYIKEGDVIKSVNGYKLNSPHQLFKAYRKLKDKENLHVDIVRGEKPLVLTYRIKK